MKKLILIFLLILSIGCIEYNQSTQPQTATPISTPTPIVATQTPVVAPSLELEIKCDMCHKNSENLTPHVGGGQYCEYCHGLQEKVHKIHTGEDTKNVDCSKCHGNPPTRPKPRYGLVVCEDCHGYPDPLTPSYGNLVNIHLPHGVYCTNCHGYNIYQIHENVLKVGSGNTTFRRKG